MFFYGESLKFEHLSQVFPLKLPWDEMHMIVFDTSIAHGLSGAREVLFIFKIFFHICIYHSEFKQLAFREFICILLMLIWHHHKMIWVTRIGEQIFQDIPIFPFQKSMSRLPITITKWTFIFAEDFLTCESIILFSGSYIFHKKIMLRIFVIAVDMRCSSFFSRASSRVNHLISSTSDSCRKNTVSSGIDPR